jgi:hypothetical protein
MRISTPCRPASSQNRPIKSVDQDGQQAVENDKKPHRKTGVPKESIDHECASSVKTIWAKYTRTGIDLNGSNGWKRSFDDPIPLPRGRQLVTLQDAGNYITKLPKAEHDAAEWQAAMEALILVAEHGGPTMFARIGVMRALNRHVDRVFNPDRKDHHWGRRRLARNR